MGLPTTDYLGGDRRRAAPAGIFLAMGWVGACSGECRRGGEERRLPRRYGLPMPSGRSVGPHGKDGNARRGTQV